MSRKLSAAVKKDGGGEFGALAQDETGVAQEIYSKEVRKSKVRNLIIWGAVNSVLCVYIFFLLVIFWQSWEVHCVR